MTLDNYQTDITLIPILLKMSRRGIALRQEAIEWWYHKLSQEILFYRDICSDEGFDPSKNQQVGYVLASRGNVLPFTRNRKQLKTDKDTLLKLDDPLAQVVLKFRSVNKLRGTYIIPSRGKSRFYTNFKLDLSTGRLASYDRNIQNIPSVVREIFAPDTGIWTRMDWNQIEMRIFAHLSQDPVMLKAYEDGEDIHWITQSTLWPGSDRNNKSIRVKAKTFNFAMIFNAKVYTLVKHTGLPEAICREYRNKWLGKYEGARRYMLKQEALQVDYVETMFGQRLRLPSVEETSQGHVNTCKINYPTQGTAAGVIKRVMNYFDTLSFDQVIQVHDEILVDGDVDPPEGLERIIPELYLPFTIYKSPVWT